MKKKVIVLFILLFLLTGCTIVRIDTTSIDNIVDVVLSKDNRMYNHMGIGYKYYVPKGVSYIDSSDSNDKLYSNGVYYYLYLDKINYYYKNAEEYEEDTYKYYSRKIDNDGVKGYIEITKQNENYLVEFVYNYAKIEALTTKDNLENVVLNSTYILSTIKYNKNIVKLSLEQDGNKKEKYEEFTSKKETDSFLRYEEE